MNRQNRLPKAFFTMDREWILDIGGFEEELASLPQANIESGNEAPELTGRDAEAAVNSKIETIEVRSEGRNISYSLANYQLHFRIEDDHVALERLVKPRENRDLLIGRDAEVLHTSILRDQTAFSILIGVTEIGRREILQFTFIPNGRVNASIFTAENFYYLLGKGVKLAWKTDDPRTLTICRPPTAENSMSEWMKHLKNRAQFATAESNSCPPFSDLNNHGIFVIDEWIEIQGSPGYAGLTIPTADLAGGFLIDSDILMMRGELEESALINGYTGDVKAPGAEYEKGVRSFYADTMIHEIGHWLGLHHQFNKSVPSIMGYNDLTSIQAYDIQAVQALYPLKEPINP
jgi:hypothetical protein